MKNARWLVKHKPKVGDKRAKKKLGKWLGKTTTTVTGSKRHKRLSWI